LSVGGWGGGGSGCFVKKKALPKQRPWGWKGRGKKSERRQWGGGGAVGEGGKGGESPKKRNQKKRNKNRGAVVKRKKGFLGLKRGERKGPEGVGVAQK